MALTTSTFSYHQNKTSLWSWCFFGYLHLFAKSWSPIYSFLLSPCQLVSALTGGIFSSRLIATLFSLSHSSWSLTPSVLRISGTLRAGTELRDHLQRITWRPTSSRSQTELVAELELRFSLPPSQAWVLLILSQTIPCNFLHQSHETALSWLLFCFCFWLFLLSPLG